MLLFLTVATVLWLTVSILVLAHRKPGYSHLVHTISELGEVSTPDQSLAAFAVFLPVGAVLVGLSFMLSDHSRSVAGLAAAIGTGYLVAAFFPCDVGSPVRGTMRQDMHNLGGAIEYLGGAAALFSCGETIHSYFRPAGLVVFGTAVALTALPQKSVRGMIQRIGETVLMGSLIYLVREVA
ncbi:MAG: DUF998 domain-containing protein [Planctomyces sp.]|nr:DUF998 domain-containing protein [Planctomyces sp.]